MSSSKNTTTSLVAPSSQVPAAAAASSLLPLLTVETILRQGTVKQLKTRFGSNNNSNDIAQALAIQTFGRKKQSALHVAAHANNLPMLRFLLNEVHMDPMLLRDADGSTALHLAAQHPADSCESVKYLLEQFPLLTTLADNFGKNALNVAQAWKKSNVVTLIAKHQVSLAQAVAAQGMSNNITSFVRQESNISNDGNCDNDVVEVINQYAQEQPADDFSAVIDSTQQLSTAAAAAAATQDDEFYVMSQPQQLQDDVDVDDDSYSADTVIAPAGPRPGFAVIEQLVFRHYENMEPLRPIQRRHFNLLQDEIAKTLERPLTKGFITIRHIHTFCEDPKICSLRIIDNQHEIAGLDFNSKILMKVFVSNNDEEDGRLLIGDFDEKRENILIAKFVLKGYRLLNQSDLKIKIYGSATPAVRMYEALKSCPARFYDRYFAVGYCDEIRCDEEDLVHIGLNHEQTIVLSHMLAPEQVTFGDDEQVNNNNNFHRRCGVFLCAGPPGTGKSHMIHAILKQHQKLGAVLVCSPSNKAIQNLAHKFVNDRQTVICILGVRQHLPQDLMPFHRETKFERVFAAMSALAKIYYFGSEHHHHTHQQHDDDDVAAVEHYHLEQLRSYSYLPLVNGLLDDPRAELSRIVRPAEDGSFEVLKKFADELEIDILKSADVVFSTLVASGSYFFQQVLAQHFETLIVDEAGQAQTPELMIPTPLVKHKILLVGDHKQLPPVYLSVKSDKDLSEELRPFFHRIAGRNVLQLKTQYRMHPKICQWPSDNYYEGSLVTGDSVLRRAPLCNGRYPFPPVQTFNVHYGEHQQSPHHNGSLQNEEEAIFISKLVLYLERFDQKVAQRINIIAFYAAQVNCIRNKLPEHIRDLIEVNTVDSFQGSEQDIIIISFTRSHSGLGFMSDFRRLNVALTRAKHSLIMVGNVGRLSSFSEDMRSLFASSCKCDDAFAFRNNNLVNKQQHQHCPNDKPNAMNCKFGNACMFAHHKPYLPYFMRRNQVNNSVSAVNLLQQRQKQEEENSKTLMAKAARRTVEAPQGMKVLNNRLGENDDDD